MRVYELAEKIKIPTKELIVFLKKEGIKVKNHMSTLDKDTIELILKLLTLKKRRNAAKSAKI